MEEQNYDLKYSCYVQTVFSIKVRATLSLLFRVTGLFFFLLREKHHIVTAAPISVATTAITWAICYFLINVAYEACNHKFDITGNVCRFNQLPPEHAY